jgi:AraC family transcriptional regulator
MESSRRTTYRNTSDARGGPLPCDCSIRPSTDATVLDTVHFRGGATMIGQFRCEVDQPMFRDSGPIARSIVVFPRTSVWITHEKSKPFVADPNVVTIYNRGQRYERRPISADGDCCDWFAVSDELARDIVAAFDPRDAESDGVFRFESAHSTSWLYLYQRRVARAAAFGAGDLLGTEERVIRIVSSVMSLAYHRPPARFAGRASAVRRRRDLAEGAKAELVRTMTVNRSVEDIAAALGVSPFHLCRVFRAQTGRTMHDYRTEARLRIALDLIGAERSRRSLSAVAYQAGFSSHSHLVEVCRRYLGETPRAIRDLLAV